MKESKLEIDWSASQIAGVYFFLSVLLLKNTGISFSLF